MFLLCDRFDENDAAKFIGSKFYDNNTAVHLAATKPDCANFIRDLVQKGENPNIVNDNGYTPLQYAVVYNHNSNVLALLTSQADVNAQNKKTGRTPLHEAAWENNDIAVRFLLDYNADVNIKDTNNAVPLVYAIQNKNMDIVRQLLDKKAILSVRDHMGLTPIHHAYNVMNEEIIKALARRDGCINDIDHNGNTILMRSLIDKEENISSILLVYQQDLHIRNSKGQTAFTLCEGNPKFENLRDMSGISAVQR